MTEQNLVIIVGCVPVWRSLFPRKLSGKKPAFRSLLSKKVPQGPQMQQDCGSDLEALRRNTNENDGVVDVERNAESGEVEILPVIPDKAEAVRRDSIELPSLDLIGKPSKRSGSL